MLEVIASPSARGALVMVHAENHDMIRWIAKRLIERGHGAPKFHGVAHHPLAEGRGHEPGDRARACSTRRCSSCTSRGARRRNTSARRRPSARGLSPRPARSTFSSPPRTWTSPGSKARSGAAARRRATRRRRRRSGRASGTAPSRCFPPTTRPTVRRDREAAAGRADHLQGNGQRRAGPRDAPADPVLRRRRQEAARPSTSSSR